MCHPPPIFDMKSFFRIPITHFPPKKFLALSALGFHFCHSWPRGGVLPSKKSVFGTKKMLLFGVCFGQQKKLKKMASSGGFISPWWQIPLQKTRVHWCFHQPKARIVPPSGVLRTFKQNGLEVNHQFGR